MTEYILIVLIQGGIFFQAPAPFVSLDACENAGETIETRIKAKFDAVVTWACIEQRRT